eukprot:GHVT01063576.1.p1 GENE.GHVT01063576.1~~GHVT01063576.1.p1  ORF type:complete len:177 (+),score=23.46 GHVT01063576.1:443-973(+)
MMTTVIERDEEFSSRMPTVRIESPPSPTEFDDQGIAGADQEEVPVASAAPTPMEETAEDLPDASNVATAGLTMEAPPRRSLGLRRHFCKRSHALVRRRFLQHSRQTMALALPAVVASVSSSSSETRGSFQYKCRNRSNNYSVIDSRRIAERVYCVYVGRVRSYAQSRFPRVWNSGR